MPEFSNYIEGLSLVSLDGTEILGLSKDGSAGGTTAQDIANLSPGGAPFVRWNFATSGASPGDFPTDLTRVYITEDDSVYPFNTWFVSDGAGGWYTK